MFQYDTFLLYIVVSLSTIIQMFQECILKTECWTPWLLHSP